MSVLLEGRSYRPFKSSEEYLIAMKEDLAEWLNALYPELRINLDNFMDRLDTGVALCKVSVSQWFACQLTTIAEARLSVRFNVRHAALVTRRSLSATYRRRKISLAIAIYPLTSILEHGCHGSPARSAFIFSPAGKHPPIRSIAKVH